MATITRTNLIDAVEHASTEFVSREAKHRLLAWAYDAGEFTFGDWDNCPLDQVGLVNKFATRSQFSPEENERFAFEASEIDARIAPHIKTPLTGEVSGLKVKVV